MLGRRVALLSVFCLTLAVAPVYSREHKKHEDFGMGLSTEVAAPEREVLEAVAAIVDNGIIQLPCRLGLLSRMVDWPRRAFVHRAGIRRDVPLEVRFFLMHRAGERVSLQLHLKHAMACA